MTDKTAPYRVLLDGMFVHGRPHAEGATVHLTAAEVTELEALGEPARIAPVAPRKKAAP